MLAKRMDIKSLTFRGRYGTGPASRAVAPTGLKLGLISDIKSDASLTQSIADVD